MLKIDELKVSYGGIEAVKGITFEVPDGKIVTLIGANGAGKSTTLRSIAGLVKPAHGRIHLQGEDITALSPDRIVSKGITLVPEGRHVFPDLTVLENLKIGAYLRKDSLEDDLNWVYELFPRLKERSWQAAVEVVRIHTLSHRLVPSFLRHNICHMVSQTTVFVKSAAPEF